MYDKDLMVLSTLEDIVYSLKLIQDICDKHIDELLNVSMKMIEDLQR